MRQVSYLNGILTVNAVLLAGVLWTQMSNHGSLASSAVAQSGTGAMVGVPNAADQRQRMIDAMREIKASVEATRKILESGKFKVEIANVDSFRKVEVTNLADIKLDRPAK